MPRMSFLVDLAYAIAAIPALPILLRKRARTGKYRTGLAGRMGMGPDILAKRSRQSRVLLLHCVSVGELNSVQTLVTRLLAAQPHLHIVITTTTDTGTDRAAKLHPPSPAARVHTARFPFDFSFAVESLLDRVRPDAVALVELETWPNFLSIARSRRIPVVLINGRLSEKSFPRYRLIRPLMRAMLRQLEWIAIQTPNIAARFLALGADPANLEIIPTLKYDNAHISDHVAGQEALAVAMGLSPDHRLFVAGSTGPGEEEAILQMYQELSPQFPSLRLAIAPRHPEVVPQVIAAIRARGLAPVRRSERPDAATTSNPHPHTLDPPHVFMLDTMGELRKLYALSYAAFVGRSLIKKGGGGSDMIEVAALAKPSCFGPFTSNFAEVVELLVAGGAASQIQDAATLAQTVKTWLAHPDQAQSTGRRAQDLIRQQQGSTDRYVQKLLALFRPL